MSLRTTLFLTAVLLVLALLPAAGGSAQTASDPAFAEREGLLVIELESVTGEGWLVDSSLSGYRGSGYLHFRGENRFAQPGHGLLTYPITINTPGTYRVQWHSRIASGESRTDNNDSWLRLPDATDFYATSDGQRVYPRGSGKTPLPEGAGAEGWFKVYQNVRGSWTWQTSTFDNHPHEIYVVFAEAGRYTLEIAGRSTHHAIDRLVLYRQGIAEAFATDPAREPSPRR